MGILRVQPSMVSRIISRYGSVDGFIQSLDQFAKRTQTNRRMMFRVPAKYYHPCFVGTSVKYSWQVFLAKSEATHQLTVIPMFVQW